MSNRPGFFSLLAESQRRKDNIRRNSDRETQRRVPLATPNPTSEHGELHAHVNSDSSPRNSTPTVKVTNSGRESVNFAAPALRSVTLWRPCTLDGEFQSKSLSDCTEQAAMLCAGLFEAEDHLASAETVWDELGKLRQHLQTLLDCTVSSDERLQYRAIGTLADIYGQLGDYDKALDLLSSVCPTIPLTRDGLSDLREWHKVDMLLRYLHVLLASGRDFAQVEQIVRVLPWATPDVLRTNERKFQVLMTLIKVFNCKGRHEDAYESLSVYELTTPLKFVVDRDYYLQKAIATAGTGMQEEAEALFVDAFVLSSINNGAWNPRTLRALYEFGRATKAWRKHPTAVALLTIAALGYYHTLGPSHPLSVQVYELLESCKNADASIQRLRRFGHSPFSRGRKSMMAYEHIFLTTPIEVLREVTAVDYKRISATLEKLLATLSLSRRAQFNAERSLAWCAIMESNLSVASSALYELYPAIKHVATSSVSTDAYRATLAADEAICFARSGDIGMGFMRQRSKLVYLGMQKLPKDQEHQSRALLRRLKVHDLCHFTRDVVFDDPPLVIETNRESLGSGSFATVDAVQVGSSLYARKSIGLPRQVQHQGRLREDILKEIEIVNTLDHPHVVWVILTYEETRRFSIVMHPLADCDLQTFMASKICNSDKERQLMRKWMACLVNTLAFIHSKDIRHKDIKPSNVLVKGEKVYFTDFGSGHMFSDTGNSTTEGLSYGHTRAYCAPEVITMENRNRSSDIFSFGCVLAEMVAWSCGISIIDYFTCIGASATHTDIVQYSESLVRIHKWFNESTRLDGLSKDIHSQVLKHMLNKKPERRWKAVQISQAISQLVASECAKCDIEWWIPDSKISLE